MIVGKVRTPVGRFDRFLSKSAPSAHCACWRRAVNYISTRAKRMAPGKPLVRGSIMATSEGYGQRLAGRLRVEQAPAIVTRVLRTADMAVTETRCDAPALGLSGSLQREDAFLVGLSLRDFPNRVYWEEGRLASVC